MPIEEDVDLKKLANTTHGFVGADLESLCKESAMRVVRRILPEIKTDDEEIPEEVLKKIIVTKDDFKSALKEIQPSALREVLVQVPDVKWDDVGGLEDAKQELQEAVEWPLKYSWSKKTNCNYDVTAGNGRICAKSIEIWRKLFPCKAFQF